MDQELKYALKQIDRRLDLLERRLDRLSEQVSGRSTGAALHSTTCGCPRCYPSQGGGG